MGDNAPVIDDIRKGSTYCDKHINRDLFDLLFQYIEQKNIRLDVVWMPSHLDDPSCKKTRPEYVSDHYILHNKHADALADLAAANASVADDVALRVRDNTKLVVQIQSRIAAIYTNLPKRN